MMMIRMLQMLLIGLIVPWIHSKIMTIQQHHLYRTRSSTRRRREIFLRDYHVLFNIQSGFLVDVPFHVNHPTTSPNGMTYANNTSNKSCAKTITIDKPSYSPWTVKTHVNTSKNNGENNNSNSNRPPPNHPHNNNNLRIRIRQRLLLPPRILSIRLERTIGRYDWAPRDTRRKPSQSCTGRETYGITYRRWWHDRALFVFSRG
mmetsp:Transcript_1392/g.2405  ORF Transcript_1392/g.2405 Transcript_1392/m.2405 type:complete len:203 (+) Transcript_1392:2-610(+)